MPDSQYLQNCKGFIAAEDLKVRKSDKKPPFGQSDSRCRLEKVSDNAPVQR